ncbi:MAG: hypothetical protein WBB36_07640, partial [Chitinophagales bacterium]
MKKLIFFILFLIGALQFSLAQQTIKEGKYSMQKRQHKLEYSNPGDVSIRTYTHLKKENLIAKPHSNNNYSKKTAATYRETKK